MATVAEVIAGTAAWGVDCCDALAGLRGLPDGCVQCCLTSPPFFGLRSYLPAGHPDKGNEIGLEDTPDAYTARLVEVFQEVRRVLHPSGVLWLNLGDSFAGGKSNAYDGMPALAARCRGGSKTLHLIEKPERSVPPGLKAKDLLGIPWLAAFALRADGWYLRCAPPWVKQNCMPESVTDRPTTAHEYWFLLAKEPRYFWDADAVRVPSSPSALARSHLVKSPSPKEVEREAAGFQPGLSGAYGTGRNLRTSDVFYQGLDDLIEQERAWLAHLEHVRARGGMLLDREGDPLALCYPTFAFPGAHFATFSPHMITPLLKAATSERGCCPACGAPWRRVARRVGEVPQTRRRRKLVASEVEHSTSTGGTDRSTLGAGSGGDVPLPARETVGWRPSCACPPADAVPCLVLDCFAGSGTVGLVARRLGRRFVGLDLNAEYCDMARRRIADDQPLFNGAAPAPAPPPGRTLFDSPAPEED